MEYIIKEWNGNEYKIGSSSYFETCKDCPLFEVNCGSILNSWFGHNRRVCGSSFKYEIEKIEKKKAMKIKIDGDIYEIKKRKGLEGEVSDDYLLGILRGVHSAMGNYSSREDVIEVLEDAIPSFMELVEYEDKPIIFEF